MGMRTIPTSFYGDNTRWFVGRCINSTPPTGLEGRIRVRIFGIHSDNTNDIPEADLPWAQVMNPSHSYGVSGLGVGTHIMPNALVFGIFLDGINSQLPMVLGSLPQIEKPTSIQAKGREDIATNPFAYNFDQTNSQQQDPEFYGTADGPNVARFFIDNGLGVKQAAAMAGSLEVISKLDPEFDGGIAGYPEEGSRYSKMVSFGARLSPQRDKDRIDVQLMFVLMELRTSHSDTYSGLISSTSFEEMVAVIDKYFVHPLTTFDEAAAKSKAESIYASLGAR